MGHGRHVNPGEDVKIPGVINEPCWSGICIEENNNSTTGLSKVKHKCYFIYATITTTNPTPTPPALLLCVLSLGRQVAVPQKADMPRLRGEQEQWREIGSSVVTQTEHALNTCSSSPPLLQHTLSLRTCLTFRDNRRVW